MTQLLIIIYNHKYAGIDYDFHGWKYKVTTFGHWAAARAKYKGKVAIFCLILIMIKFENYLKI
ncbi:hypothetical protein [Mesomycoplasma dispar]|uniref:hypothetical protein n=1 Tax=Mesomycoplasma dispar TaxID=86660 RepID=UPI001E4A50E1|nr:hypothetical protein [Mesomycoplasma dispar]